MIQAAVAINYIEKGVKSLISSGQILGKVNRSNSTLSLYIDAKNPTPPKAVRSSNHNPNTQNMAVGKRKPWKTLNISIEFYEPQITANGRVKKNIILTNVRQLPKYPRLKPFSITVYEYQASELEPFDVELIYNEIVNFILYGRYYDPLINTEKAAKVITKQAQIPGIPQPSKNDVPQNIIGDRVAIPSTSTNYGADYISESKRIIRLNESDIRKMVCECVRMVLSETAYKPIAHNKTIKLPNGVEVESLITLSDGAGRFDIYEDDGCYVVRDRNLDGDKDSHPWYIFPELLSALKKLPNLPLR